MMCQCGGETTARIHTVKTITAAREWDASIQPEDLPVEIDRVSSIGS